MRPTHAVAAGIFFVVAASSPRARGESIVQLPVDGLLDGRPVSTLTGGAVVPWTTGVDQDDAFMTMAAATSLHQPGPALPDDGIFPANAEHPEVRLHFSNAAAATSPQAHLVTAVGSLELAVPPATYATIFLFLTSSYGDAPLAIKMTYTDQTTTTTTFTLPDWGTGAALPKGPPRFFNLIAGLHKWNKAGASLDTPSHTITGVALTPAPDRVLATLEITKTTAMPWLTFWGATALATSALAVADAGDGALARDGAVVDALAADGGEASVDAALEVVEVDATGGQAGSEVGASASAGASGASGAGGAAPVVSGAVDASAAPLAHPAGGCALGNGRSAPLASTLVALTFVFPWWRRGRRATMTSHENVAGSRDRPRARLRLRRHERAEERRRRGALGR